MAAKGVYGRDLLKNIKLFCLVINKMCNHQVPQETNQYGCSNRHG